VTSQINYLSINENFPVPGQDNDTQVFRDNFDTIKNSLRLAKDEISVLQNTVSRVGVQTAPDAPITATENDFNLSTVENAVVSTLRESKWDYGNVTTNDQSIDFENGHYQVIRIVGTNINLTFANFPGDNSVNNPELGAGRIRLEIYADNTIRTITFTQPGGVTVKRSGFPGAIFTHSSTSNPVILEIWRHKTTTDNIYIRYLGIYE
jgi:hypothetical protein